MNVSEEIDKRVRAAIIENSKTLGRTYEPQINSLLPRASRDGGLAAGVVGLYIAWLNAQAEFCTDIWIAAYSDLGQPIPESHIEKIVADIEQSFDRQRTMISELHPTVLRNATPFVEAKRSAEAGALIKLRRAARDMEMPKRKPVGFV